MKLGVLWWRLTYGEEHAMPLCCQKITERPPVLAEGEAPSIEDLCKLPEDELDESLEESLPHLQEDGRRHSGPRKLWHSLSAFLKLF